VKESVSTKKKGNSQALGRRSRKYRALHSVSKHESVTEWGVMYVPPSEVDIAVFPILADPDKNNLQSAQLLVG